MADSLFCGESRTDKTGCRTEDTKTTATDALRKGLQDMVEACDVVSEKFTAARDEFAAEQ